MTELPDSSPPYYFKRLWDPKADTPEEMLVQEVDGDTVKLTVGVLPDDLPDYLQGVEVISIRDDPLLIYGRKIESTYPEDRAFMRLQEQRGYIYTESFSVACVEGELGSQPLGLLTEISKGDFEAARKVGWT